jgi:hypothetical protein
MESVAEPNFLNEKANYYQILTIIHYVDIHYIEKLI